MRGTASDTRRSRCARLLTGRTAFTFRESGAEIVRCLRCGLIYMQMVRRSVLAALVVGSVLTMLNQGDVLVSGSWPDALY